MAALGDVVRARNLRSPAGDVRMNPDQLSKVLSGTGNPRFTTIGRPTNALGFRVKLEPVKTL